MKPEQEGFCRPEPPRAPRGCDPLRQQPVVHERRVDVGQDRVRWHILARLQLYARGPAVLCDDVCARAVSSRTSTPSRHARSYSARAIEKMPPFGVPDALVQFHVR